MIPRLAAVVLLVALAWSTGGPVGAAPPAGAPPVSARALLAGLRRTGRAEATVRLRRTDALSGRTVERGGRLALELPGRARLDFDDGERLTLRPDGGDWLQPALRQLVRVGPRGAAGALQWWGALLDPAGAGLEERRAGERSFTLRVRGGAAGAASVQRLELDGRGLPRRLVLQSAEGGSLEYRVSGWRFVRARGAGAFTLAAPAGVEVVTLP
jgi:outer membrane lipoprotein-sorting protein